MKQETKEAAAEEDMNTMKQKLYNVAFALIIGYFIYCIPSFVVGSFLAGFGVSHGLQDVHKCSYKTFASRSNLGYFLGCELFRERF